MRKRRGREKRRKNKGQTMIKTKKKAPIHKTTKQKEGR